MNGGGAEVDGERESQGDSAECGGQHGAQSHKSEIMS